MKRVAHVALIIIFIFIVVELVIIAPKTLDVREATKSTDRDIKNRNFDQQMQGVHSVGASKEGREWELWSDKAISFKKDKSWELTKVKIKFFTDIGDYYLVESDKGTVDHETRNISVSGNTRIQSMNGFIFLVDTLTYNSKDKLLSSMDAVSVLGPKSALGRSLNLTGKGLSGDMKTSDMTILEDVYAEKLYQKGQQLVKIKSSVAKINGNKYVANFLKNVVIDSRTMRISGEVAGVQLDPKGEKINVVQVEGGVRVTDTDKWATAQQLVAYFEEQKFVFKGSPRLVQDSDELRGDEIIFLDGGKRVKIKKAKAKIESKRLERTSE